MRMLRLSPTTAQSVIGKLYFQKWFTYYVPQLRHPRWDWYLDVVGWLAILRDLTSYTGWSANSWQGFPRRSGQKVENRQKSVSHPSKIPAVHCQCIKKFHSNLFAKLFPELSLLCNLDLR